MKIGVAGLRGIPDVSGGVETHCEQLYTRIAALPPDRDIVVYGRRPYVIGERRSLQRGLTIHPLPAARSRYLEALSNTAAAILSARFNERRTILHIHAIGPALLAPLARLLGFRVVMTHHGDDFLRVKWNGFAKGALKLGERLGVGASHRIIAVSPSLARRLKHDYPSRATHIHYIPNGADHIGANGGSDVDGRILQRYGLKDGEYVVSVGRLVPEKGFADLIDAHRMAATGLKLVIVGGASGSDHDAELKASAGPDVIFTDTVPRADVGRILQGACLFVLASHHEGLPIAALEAAAAGTPVLLSDIQPNRDLGLSADHYFPKGDRQTLARRLSELADGGAKKLRADIPVQDFAWDRIAARTAAIYDDLAEPATEPS